MRIGYDVRVSIFSRVACLLSKYDACLVLICCAFVQAFSNAQYEDDFILLYSNHQSTNIVPVAFVARLTYHRKDVYPLIPCLNSSSSCLSHVCVCVWFFSAFTSLWKNKTKQNAARLFFVVVVVDQGLKLKRASAASFSKRELLVQLHCTLRAEVLVEQCPCGREEHYVCVCFSLQIVGGGGGGLVFFRGGSGHSKFIGFPTTTIFPGIDHDILSVVFCASCAQTHCPTKTCILAL